MKGAYIIRCEDFIKNEEGEVTELHCTYYPDSRSGSDTSGVKSKGVLHWVSVPHAIEAKVRLYDRLFTEAAPTANENVDFIEYLNPNSLEEIENVFVEPSLINAKIGQPLQFMRKGYFCLDPDSTADNLIFNRTITLKDSWAKIQKKN